MARVAAEAAKVLSLARKGDLWVTAVDEMVIAPGRAVDERLVGSVVAVDDQTDAVGQRMRATGLFWDEAHRTSGCERRLCQLRPQCPGQGESATE